MEEKKAKMGISGMLIVAIVFIIMGIAFLPTGVGIYLSGIGTASETIIFLAVFGGTGGVFLIVGGILLALFINKKKRYNRLLKNGQYVMAEIAEVRINYSVQVNARHPYVVHCRYQDNYGNIHIFKSRNLMFNPMDIMKDNMVKVYVDGENYKYYYVDIDEILPNIIEH